MASEFPSSFTIPWKQLISSRKDDGSSEFPCFDAATADKLITTSIPTSLWLGTGHSIYERAIAPAIRSAQHSIHLVTCFWADSTSSRLIRDALLELASSRAASNPASLPTLHVTIGLSSRGLLQKLLHTPSKNGYTYPPSKWKELGLPDQGVLSRGSIKLTVKSLFFTPFSVMHPKYLIVDRTTAYMPSCNVSWERWFEGCIEFRGDAVNTLLSFHKKVWGLGTASRNTSDANASLPALPSHREQSISSIEGDDSSLLQSGSTETPTRCITLSETTPVPTILLPSSHHRNPRYSWLSFLMRCEAPLTPLNAALLTLFANATRNISIISPNVTSKPVIEAILDAVTRGVDVQIRTSKNLMLLEQLMTAGTTTSWCLKRLIRKYKQLVSRQASQDPEQGSRIGQLNIYYYKPVAQRLEKLDEPVFSHFKMTMVDDEYLVLGSGNMDRASWWTSQELGILLFVPGFQHHVTWERVLSDRADPVFLSRSVGI